jgi:23S rRNA pseudouridine955/2504/2580 synthase
MAHIGTPILGDEKYGGVENLPDGVPNRLHLHARRIIFPHPREGVIDISAPMPEHMLQTFDLFGFDPARFDEDHG